MGVLHAERFLRCQWDIEVGKVHPAKQKFARSLKYFLFFVVEILALKSTVIPIKKKKLQKKHETLPLTEPCYYIHTFSTAAAAAHTPS